ncbi:putative outer membrane protein [Helicobacter pylori Hp P-16]|nr:putative outer membrane protein [Helicobacter pylori Hp P-16]
MQFAQSQNRMLSSLSSQIAQISNSLNALDPSSYSKNISSMYGVSLSVGYKHFFTKKKIKGFAIICSMTMVTLILVLWVTALMV